MGRAGKRASIGESPGTDASGTNGPGYPGEDAFGGGLEPLYVSVGA